MGLGGQHHAPAAFIPGKDPVPSVQEAGWASETVWIVAENLATAGIRSPDLRARSESLYRLRDLGFYILTFNIKYLKAYKMHGIDSVKILKSFV